MPAQKPAPGIARVVCTGLAQGQTIANVFHVRISAGGTPWTELELNNLVTRFKNLYEANMVPRMASHYSGDKIEARDLTSITGAFADAALAGSSGSAGTTVPQSAAACITWKIPRHYRGGHPRTYIGPLATTSIESPVSLTAAFVTALSAAAGALLGGINSDTSVGRPIKMVCLHRTMDKQLLDPPQNTDILDYTVDTRIDSQRRRMGPDR